MDALLQKVRGEVHALRAQQVEAERKHRSELATAQLQYQNDLLKHQVSAVLGKASYERIFCAFGDV